MAKLSELGIKIAAAIAVRFVGKPELTSFISTSGKVDEPYYVWRLKNPVTVLCSMDAEILPQEVDELYLRQSLLDSNQWESDKDGAYIPDFITDFSLGQKVCLYQQETIRAFVREDRKGRKPERAHMLNTSILSKMEERRNKATGK